jgi:asparagine synthase (glutamine-hydrolysing)
MRDTMAHRGPSDALVGLAHQRFSIVDLSEPANQPMSSQDESLWIVYNGEVHSHAETRADLDRNGGFQWKTDHSDTESILYAFQQWGSITCSDLMGCSALPCGTPARGTYG